MYKPALDKPYITLTCYPYEDESSVNTRITFDVMEKDLLLGEVLEVLENFLKAAGYHFGKGEALTVEKDELSD